jgi:hypothetical protein
MQQRPCQFKEKAPNSHLHLQGAVLSSADHYENIAIIHLQCPDSIFMSWLADTRPVLALL